MEIINFLGQWWGIVILILSIIGYVLVNKSNAKAFAYRLMLIAEEKAEEYVLENGLEKKKWVLDQYSVLPKQIKLFISKEMWEELIQELFDQALTWAEQNSVKVEKNGQ